MVKGRFVIAIIGWDLSLLFKSSFARQPWRLLTLTLYSHGLSGSCRQTYGLVKYIWVSFSSELKSSFLLDWSPCSDINRRETLGSRVIISKPLHSDLLPGNSIHFNRQSSALYLITCTKKFEGIRRTGREMRECQWELQKKERVGVKAEFSKS